MVKLKLPENSHITRRIKRKFRELEFENGLSKPIDEKNIYPIDFFQTHYNAVLIKCDKDGNEIKKRSTNAKSKTTNKKTEKQINK